MEILILCNQNDAIAIALYQRLADKGEKTCLVTAEDLQYATSWTHKLDRKGKGNTEIILQNNNTIQSQELKAVWNRIRYFPMAHFKNETDRYYAQNEMSALFFSFLKSIDTTLINPVNTFDLAIEEENFFYLKHQAIIAGLTVLDYHFTTSPRWQSSKNMIPITLHKKSVSTFHRKAPHLVWQNQPVIFTEPSGKAISVWIVGKKILDNKIILQKEALKKLSKNLKKDLLEVQFTKTSNEYKVSFINSFPTYAPQHVVDSLALLLTTKTGKAT